MLHELNVNSVNDVGTGSIEKSTGAIENGYWKVWVNQEVYEEFKSPGIVIVIKMRRLEWLGWLKDCKEVTGKLAGRRGRKTR